MRAPRDPRAPARRRAPTPADLVLLVALVGAAAGSAHRAPATAATKQVLVLRAAGAEQRVDAGVDRDYTLAGPLGTTIVRVARGEAWVERAPCPNQLCVRMGRLHAPGRALVCMPNRILVRFEGAAGAGAGVDAVTR